MPHVRSDLALTGKIKQKPLGKPRSPRQVEGVREMPYFCDLFSIYQNFHNIESKFNLGISQQSEVIKAGL